jgi:hypothetical protein
MTIIRMEGLNAKRMAVSLLVAGLFGVFCAYGTSSVEIPGFTVTMQYLATIFYARLLIGLAVGLAGSWVIVQGKSRNAAIRGAIIGAVVTPVIALYGGFEIFMLSGILYGMITDVLATWVAK